MRADPEQPEPGQNDAAGAIAPAPAGVSAATGSSVATGPGVVGGAGDGATPADAIQGPGARALARPSVLATAVARALGGLVRGYQLAVSPVMAPHCRYWPSCSDYAIEALREHGAARGSWMAVGRLCRCHPWAAGGVDPVPPAPLPGDAALARIRPSRTSRFLSLRPWRRPTSGT